MAQENIVVDLIDGSLEAGDIHVSNAYLDVDSVLHLQREYAEELTVDFYPMMNMYDDTHVDSGSFNNRTKQLTLKFNNSNVSDVTIDLSSLTVKEFAGKNYDPLHVYDVGDIVTSPAGNRVYLAITNPQTGSPGTENSGWVDASVSGEKGDKGDPGIQGPPGNEGPAGSGVYVRGSDTVANILSKPNTDGDMWIATDSGVDSLGAAVVPGDGLVSGTSQWINVGPIRGPQGIQGTQGNDGSDGIDGADGSDGQQGLTGPEGPDGPAGEDGRTILNGNVDPSGSIGENGDFYINTSTNYMFGPKTGGSWGVGTKIIGEDGPVGEDGEDGIDGEDGAKGDQGTGVPPGGVETDVLAKGPGDTTLWQPLADLSDYDDTAIWEEVNKKVGKDIEGTSSVSDNLWVGTIAEYNAIPIYKAGVLYFVREG